MNDLIRLDEAIEIIAQTDITDGTEPVFSGKQVQGLLKDLDAVPAIPISENATNGDMIKALFPCLEKYEYEEPYTHGIALAGNDNRVTWFANEWWNAPYKRGDTECPEKKQ